MCGIAGYFALTPRSLAPREVLGRMVEAVRHRGPDDAGIYYDGRAALGHRRLSIIDLSGGKQPLATADGNLWVTFNGEIFNHVELRDELIARGAAFRTKSDTETILHAYEHDGPLGPAQPAPRHRHGARPHGRAAAVLRGARWSAGFRVGGEIAVRLSWPARRARPAGTRPVLARALLGRTRLVRPLVAVAQKLMEIITGIRLSAHCEIGDGLYIGHYGCIIVAPECRIGHNCSLAQNVTIGVAGSGEHRGAPVIGNRVFIGAHSVIVGRITVGDDAVVCAGSVVMRPVPARAMVMGNSARVVSYEGSFEYVFYDGMDVDPARRASLEKARSLNAGPA